jgi:3-oxoacyl-[acyl-carrier protein] reductase
LGAVIAQRLAGDGWAVAVNDLPAMMAAAEEVAAGIAAKGGRAVAVGADVTDEEHVHALVERVGESLGPVSVLVVNATGPQPVIRLEALTWQDHLSHLELFVKSPTLLTQAVLPGMKAAGHGRIVQIGSEMAETALAGWSHYVAAKSAQLGLTRCWARELGPHNITVNLVAPGWIPVERHAQATADELSDYLAAVPLARIGTPHDVAASHRRLPRLHRRRLPHRPMPTRQRRSHLLPLNDHEWVSGRCRSACPGLSEAVRFLHRGLVRFGIIAGSLASVRQ